MEALTKKWYVVVNDVIGGWSIATHDAPVSQLSVQPAEHLADVWAEEVAQTIVEEHNLVLTLRANGVLPEIDARSSEELLRDLGFGIEPPEGS